MKKKPLFLLFFEIPLDTFSHGVYIHPHPLKASGRYLTLPGKESKDI